MHWKYWHYCFALGCSGMLNDAPQYFTMHCAAAECTGMQWRKSASSTFSAKAQHPPPSGKQSVEKRNLTDDSFQVCIARLFYRQMSFKHRLRALSGWRGMVIIIRSSWLICTLQDDEAVCWLSIGHYEAVVGNWWYWVRRGHFCLYILHKVEIWTLGQVLPMPDSLTDWQLWKIELLSSL